MPPFVFELVQMRWCHHVAIIDLNWQPLRVCNWKSSLIFDNCAWRAELDASPKSSLLFLGIYAARIEVESSPLMLCNCFFLYLYLLFFLSSDFFSRAHMHLLFPFLSSLFSLQISSCFPSYFLSFQRFFRFLESLCLILLESEMLQTIAVESWICFQGWITRSKFWEWKFLAVWYSEDCGEPFYGYESLFEGWGRRGWGWFCPFNAEDAICKFFGRDDLANANRCLYSKLILRRRCQSICVGSW